MSHYPVLDLWALNIPPGLLPTRLPPKCDQYRDLILYTLAANEKLDRWKPGSGSRSPKEAVRIPDFARLIDGSVRLR